MKYDLAKDLKLLKSTKRLFAAARVFKSLTLVCTGMLIAGDVVYAFRRIGKSVPR